METSVVYKEIDSGELHLYVFQPDDLEKTARLPAIVFFHGGRYGGPDRPKQFYAQCRYLASRGMVAITAERRTIDIDQDPAFLFKWIADTKSAIRWVRTHAEDLQADPDKVVAGGGSFGGALALVTALIEGFDEPGEDSSVSVKPAALVLFNPAVGSRRWDAQVSLPNHIAPGMPPAIVFHGTSDEAVPFASVQEFTHKVQAAGNSCELIAYEGMPHGFFNYGRFENKPYFETVTAADKFLAKLGYLSGEPTLRYEDVAPE